MVRWLWEDRVQGSAVVRWLWEDRAAGRAVVQWLREDKRCAYMCLWRPVIPQPLH